MRTLKRIIAEIKSTDPEDIVKYQALLLNYICYSPKMPLRGSQEALIGSAEKTILTVRDKFFSEQDLSFNTFKWGSGSRKILLTHGWGSKGADFYDLIVALQQVDDLEIIAFDAPGNGSSEGELSSLILFIEAVKAVITHFGQPEITIGHSLGAMANVIALSELQVHPKYFISIAPLINLGDNFKASMRAVDVSEEAQTTFFRNFEERFLMPVSHFNLIDWAAFTTNFSKHWVAYDEEDKISPFLHLQAFLAKNHLIAAKSYAEVGHERIIKSSNVIQDVLNILK